VPPSKDTWLGREGNWDKSGRGGPGDGKKEVFGGWGGGGRVRGGGEGEANSGGREGQYMIAASYAK
jgi:hypothetical protein